MWWNSVQRYKWFRYVLLNFMYYQQSLNHFNNIIIFLCQEGYGGGATCGGGGCGGGAAACGAAACGGGGGGCGGGGGGCGG